MKKLSDITSRFKMTKVRVPMEAPFSEDFQKAMFAMGFRWDDTQPGTPREVRRKHGGISTYHGLYIDQDCRISGSVVPATFNGSVITARGYREITPLELFDAAKEYKALDKQIRKDKKLAKQGWIEWNGKGVNWSFSGPTKGAGPVQPGTLVDVRYRDGEVQTKMKAGVIYNEEGRYPAGAFWGCDNAANDIVAYRPSKPEPTPDADGWIKCDNKPKVDGNVDILFRGGDTSLNTSANGWRYGVGEMEDDYDIVAYRPAKQEPAKQETISLQDMITNIVADAGGKEVVEKADWELVPMDEPVVEADTNPKKQYGLASIPLNLWSPLASAYGALGLYNGSLKYGTANFANTKVEASIYIAAAMRHLSAFAAGEEFDPADGVPNLGGVLANVAIILEARAAGTLIDDRAAMSGYLQERDALKAIVGQLQVVHAGKTPKHYTLGG